MKIFTLGHGLVGLGAHYDYKESKPFIHISQLPASKEIGNITSRYSKEEDVRIYVDNAEGVGVLLEVVLDAISLLDASSVELLERELKRIYMLDDL